MCESGSRSFYLWLGQFFGFLGLLALCLWLALRPKSPTYNILFISIEQPSSQNGTIVYTLEIENPNKDSSIYYDDTTLSFFYGQHQDKAGDTTIRSFHLGTSSSRDEPGTVNTKPGALKHLIANAILNKTAELKAALTTRFRYKTWGIKSKFHGVNLQGILPIGADGKLMLSGKKKKYKLTQGYKKLVRSVKH